MALASLCDGPLSAKDIAAQLRLAHHVRANSILGRAGRKLFETNPLEFRSRGWKPWAEDSGWYHVVAPGERSNPKASFLWFLREEIKHTIQDLGWAAPAKEKTKYTTKRIAYEGAEILRLITTRERNPILRQACIEQHGCRCFACKIDFQEAYGAIGKGFIHVHHLEPISVRQGKRNTNARTDMVPVCPNCHAMIHRYGQNRTIRTIQQALKLAKNQRKLRKPLISGS